MGHNSNDEFPCKRKKLSMYRSLVSLGRYIPKYFILFVAMVNCCNGEELFPYFLFLLSHC